MQLHPFGKAARDVIECEGPLHMPRDLDTLPGAQVLINLAARVANFQLHRFHFGVEIDVVFVRVRLEFLEPALQFQDWLFEIKRLRIHGRYGVMVTAVLVLTRLLNSSRSVALIPNPWSGGGTSSTW